MSEEEHTIWVRRTFDDWRQARYRLTDLRNPHWDVVSGGVQVFSLIPFIYAYAWCDGMLEGEVAHSGRHGSCPHEIKVCITKNANDREAFEELLMMVGPTYQATITNKRGEPLWKGRVSGEDAARWRARNDLDIKRLPPGSVVKLEMLDG